MNTASSNLNTALGYLQDRVLDSVQRLSQKEIPGLDLKVCIEFGPNFFQILGF